VALAALFFTACGPDSSDVTNPSLANLNLSTHSSSVSPVDLGTADDFVILSKSGITNVPTSVIIGNFGTSPITGAAITGLDCPQLSGTIYTVAAGMPTSLGAGTCRVVDAGKLTQTRSKSEHFAGACPLSSNGPAQNS
jgi:hypothetical protein